VSLPGPPAHPNRPSRGLLALAFVAILVAGGLGGAIGWGIVDTTCTEEPTVAEQLLEAVPDYEADERSCDLARLGGAIGGAALAAIGAGVVAALVLRAQSEWRAHPPGSARSAGAGRPPPSVNRAGSGESPPRT
jgi:hypothetical protein